VFLVALLVLAATSCEKAKSEEWTDPLFKPRDTGSLKDPAFLAYIPADAALVFASFEPPPAEFMDRIFDMMAPLGPAIDKALREANPTDPQAQALAQAFQGKLNKSGLESLGLTLAPRMAFYNVGASLILRVEIKDGAKLEQVVAAVEAAGTEHMQKDTIGSVTYRYSVEDNVLFVFAILPSEVVVGIMHPDVAVDVLPVAFLQKKPDKSVADTGALRQVVGKFGFIGSMAGYMDSRLALASFLGEGSQLTRTTMAKTGWAADTLPSECKSELKSLAELMPRIAFGYTRADKKGAEGLWVAELRPDIAAEIKDLRASMPGFRTVFDEKPLFAMGAAVDMRKSIDWVQKRARAHNAAPYQCALLLPLNEIAEDLSDAASSVPAELANFKGALMVASDFHMGIPPSGTGYALLGTDDPMSLVEMGKSLSPTLGDVNVKNDGKPVKVNLGVPGMGSLHVVVRDKWLGLAMGERQKERITKLVNAGVTDKVPLFVVGYDLGKYFRMISSTLGGINSLSGGDPDMRSTQDLMSGFAKTLGSVTYEVHASDTGLIGKFSMTFR